MLFLISDFKFLNNCIPRHHTIKYDTEQQTCLLPKFIATEWRPAAWSCDMLLDWPKNSISHITPENNDSLFLKLQTRTNPDFCKVCDRSKAQQQTVRHAQQERV